MQPQKKSLLQVWLLLLDNSLIQYMIFFLYKLFEFLWIILNYLKLSYIILHNFIEIFTNFMLIIICIVWRWLLDMSRRNGQCKEASLRTCIPSRMSSNVASTSTIMSFMQVRTCVLTYTWTLPLYYTSLLQEFLTKRILLMFRI